jgi:MoaA/NifB/PqqE/SkfB family radical SAM enzyme
MTTLTSPSTALVSTGPVFSFLWLELTGRCGLSCSHCYAGSGPAGTHGTMTADDWRSVIAQAADFGVSMVQFIGGEPTLHPEFAALLACTIDAGIAAEVYTNLTHVKDSWWDLLACPRVSLATSYYSDDPGEHDAITGRPGSHARTLASIKEALARGIPLRASIIGLHDGQRTGQARAELAALGVTRIRTDRVRGLGRAAATAAAGQDVSQLCGHCGRGIAAVLPSGDVCPCVMSRWLTAGNVRETPLAAILSGPAMAAATAAIPARSPGTRRDCPPDSDSDICPPPAASDCPPDSDSDICPPPGQLPLPVLARGAAW